MGCVISPIKNREEGHISLIPISKEKENRIMYNRDNRKKGGEEREQWG